MNKKDYLSIREAANKMGYTRQYIYKELDNKFKPYLKIIDGEKRLHINVLNEFGNNRRNNIDIKQKDKFTDNNERQDSKLSKSDLKNVGEQNDVEFGNIDTENGLQLIVSETINILRQQLSEKDRQLSEKDRQLKSLQDELNLQNEHVRQQSDRLVGLVEQVNELQRNNQVLLAQKDINNKELDEQKENKGMFSWLFKKSNN